jgi:hypothetical protein
MPEKRDITSMVGFACGVGICVLATAGPYLQFFFVGMNTALLYLLCFVAGAVPAGIWTYRKKPGRTGT